jgi:hypothetical protein
MGRIVAERIMDPKYHFSIIEKLLEKKVVSEDDVNEEIDIMLAVGIEALTQTDMFATDRFDLSAYEVLRRCFRLAKDELHGIRRSDSDALNNPQRRAIPPSEEEKIAAQGRLVTTTLALRILDKTKKSGVHGDMFSLFRDASRRVVRKERNVITNMPLREADMAIPLAAALMREADKILRQHRLGMRTSYDDVLETIEPPTTMTAAAATPDPEPQEEASLFGSALFPMALVIDTGEQGSQLAFV